MAIAIQMNGEARVVMIFVLVGEWVVSLFVENNTIVVVIKIIMLFFEFFLSWVVIMAQ